MNIEITKNEYRLLLDMLCIADWIMEAFSESSKATYPEHQTLKTKLFELCDTMDAADCIEYDETLNDYFETSEHENHIQSQFIEPYEQTVFWNELVHRLAVRDLINEVGIDALRTMDEGERLNRVNDYKQRYDQEFQTHGLDKLVIG